MTEEVGYTFTSREEYEKAVLGIGGEEGKKWLWASNRLIEAGRRPALFVWPEDEMKVRQIKLSDWTWYVLGEIAKSQGLYWGDRGSVAKLLEMIGMGYLVLGEADEWKKVGD